jgi:RNA polymerase sigma factor (sigma-70 family)
MEDEVAREFGKAEEIGLVRSALGRLPPRDRVLLTFFQDDFTYEEISRQTGIRKSSVGKLLSRAVKRLARELKQGERR